jgi:hypothetical protein
VGCRCSRGSATVSCFVVGGWIGMRFDLLGPFVRSSRSRVFRRSLLPRSGLRSQSNPSVLFSIPRFLSFVPSRGLSRLFYGLCFVGFWDRSSPSIVSLPLSASGSLCFYHFFRSLWVFRPRSQCLSFVLLDLGSATVFVLRRCSWIGRCLQSFGAFLPVAWWLLRSGLRSLVGSVCVLRSCRWVSSVLRYSPS